MEKDIRIKELETEIQYLKAQIQSLEKDKAYLQDQIELKLISIYTDTSFLKNIFTTPAPKSKSQKAIEKEKSRERKKEGIKAYILKQWARKKI